MAQNLEKINLSEAKAHLGKYVKQAKKGKVFVICERNEPVAELLGIPEPKKTRPIILGLARGQIEFKGDWNEGDSEIEDLFYK